MNNKGHGGGRHGPPWMQGGLWPGHGRSRSRWLFIRFSVAFGFMALFVVGGMATLAFFITQLFGGSGQTAILVWIGGLVLSTWLAGVRYHACHTRF